MLKSLLIVTTLLLCSILAPRELLATWSIVAVDPQTREVGAAGATCNVGIEYIVGMVPAKGVILAQAATNLEAKERGMLMLAGGGSPMDVIAQVATAEFNPGSFLSAPWTEQQYGVAALDKIPAVQNFTGADTVDWSGALARGRVSVQGNMLRTEKVLSATLAAFESYKPLFSVTDKVPHLIAKPASPSQFTCPQDLADRLLVALEAGAKAGGDKRCAAEHAALTAFVTVARPYDLPGAPSLMIVAPKAYGLLGSIRHWLVPYSPDENDTPPVTLLRQMYTEWKSAHPDWLESCSQLPAAEGKQ